MGIHIPEPRCDITCYNVQYPQSCVDVEGFEPSCGCKEGYVIDESSGICIPIDQCQKCYKEDGTPVNITFLTTTTWFKTFNIYTALWILYVVTCYITSWFCYQYQRFLTICSYVERTRGVNC
jgi:hypothetical protein